MTLPVIGSDSGNCEIWMDEKYSVHFMMDANFRFICCETGESDSSIGGKQAAEIRAVGAAAATPCDLYGRIE